MLKGKEFGAAIARAIQLKLDSGAAKTKAEIARHFGMKPPSLADWVKKGSVAKDKLPELWRYFSDVAGPDHWGMTKSEWPAGLTDDRDADHAHDKSGVALLPSSNSKADDGEAQSPAAAQPTVADLLERLRAEISTQPEAVKRAIAELMAEYVTTPDEATGRAVADAILRILGPRP
ncbi:phage repressor protein [Thauera sp. 27]|uniref:hypothetical protein n=1 Tax=Thauera sp. 27 TaxID=305700 RepID=UPI0002CDB0BB|nr:hypothetical protein [Thauera sp. 27]ENO80942.1 phage repressor protein [Thauera sp. 27]